MNVSHLILPPPVQLPANETTTIIQYGKRKTATVELPLCTHRTPWNHALPPDNKLVLADLSNTKQFNKLVVSFRHQRAASYVPAMIVAYDWVRKEAILVLYSAADPRQCIVIVVDIAGLNYTLVQFDNPVPVLQFNLLQQDPITPPMPFDLKQPIPLQWTTTKKQALRTIRHLQADEHALHVVASGGAPKALFRHLR